MKHRFPPAVKACIWSYDTDNINLSVPDHRYRIIMNILNRGTEEAVSWLFRNFSDKEIAETIKKSCESEWNKKSISFWSLIFHVAPGRKTRFA